MADNASTSVLAFHDIRWNSWRWRPILERWGDIRMLLNPAITRTASFLFVNGAIAGTIYFVEVPLDPLSHRHGSTYYAITTYHSLVNASRIAIRFNLKGGGITDEPSLPGDWIKEKSVDTAVLPLDALPLDDYEIEWIKLEHFADTDDHVEHVIVEASGPSEDVTLEITGEPYGLGDEIFSVGLFEGHSGTLQAQPAVRFGHIALKPASGEKVLAETEPGEYIEIEAYLIEMSTWKGQSGSPVFIRPRISDERTHKRPGWERSYLIGMIQGMYPGHERVKGYTQGGKELNVYVPFNMGIGILIPSRKIQDILMQDKLKKDRENKLAKKKSEPNIKPSAASLNNEFTKASFEDALKRASQKVSEPESKDSDKTE